MGHTVGPGVVCGPSWEGYEAELMVLYGPFGGGQQVGLMAEQGPMRHGQGAGQWSRVGPCWVAIEGRVAEVQFSPYLLGSGSGSGLDMYTRTWSVLGILVFLIQIFLS